MFDRAAYGTASCSNFLTLFSVVGNLEGGMKLNIGTVVIGPEIYQKAVAMARNVTKQENRVI